MTAHLIKNGVVVDGTGAPQFEGDVFVVDGLIAEVGPAGSLSAAAYAAGVEVHDAAGDLVLPGWVDVHTHYDAQVTWDPTLSPSGFNGVSATLTALGPWFRRSAAGFPLLTRSTARVQVTTVVFGNCGVSFAPCWKDDHGFLIELMVSARLRFSSAHR